MIEIKSDDLRRQVLNAHRFDVSHGKLVDSSSGQFTGNFFHETYEFNGKVRTYYFDGSVLFGYEDKE